MNCHCNKLRSWFTALALCVLAGCGGGVQAKRGELSVEPGSYDFGRIAKGTRAQGRVVVRNVGQAPLTVEAIERKGGIETHVGTNAAAIFALESLPTDAIEPGGERELHIRFTPPHIGAFSSILQIRARDGVGELTAPLILTGSGLSKPQPWIDVVPGPTLDVGPVMLFPDAPAPATKKLTVWNVGVAGPEDEPEHNLRIERLELRPLDEGSTAEEIEVLFPSSWDPDLGLVARAGKASVALDVRVTPASVGPKRWELTIVSNAPNAPRFVVEIAAEGIPAPPCRFEVTPEQLNLAFGLISPPVYLDFPIVIQNEGVAPGEQCVVWNLRLAADSHPAFSLPYGPPDRRLLQPGEWLEVPIRLTAPSGFEGVEGALEFDISSSSMPHVTVPLRIATQASPRCITIAPDAMDFGSVKGGCYSAPRTFLAYNTCSREIAISSLTVSGVPEFALVQAPAIPAEGLRLQPGAPPIVFQVQYAPLDVGTDTAAVLLETSSGSDTDTYQVPLTGTGSSPAWKTDVWAQPVEKKDLLFVIDKSPAMAPHQQSLASNLASFLQFATSTYVDFNIAVITADPGTGAAFLSGPSHPEKVLNRNTPDLAAKFADKVNVGTGGTGGPRCLEQALAALTSPLITADNAGFLRNDAKLSVICITNSADQSPLAVADYVNGFWGIKGTQRKAMFEFIAIGGFSAACSGDTGALADAVSMTDGLRDEICAPDWSESLEHLGWFTYPFGPSKFYLSATPNPARGPIEVALDGQPLPPVTPQGDVVWWFDAHSAAIAFEPAYYPRPGSTLTATYPIACTP